MSSSSRTAAVAVPLLVLASSRGVALGCRDALARLRAEHAGELAAPLRVWVLEGPRELLWLMLGVLAAVTLCVLGLRHLVWRDAALTMHAA